MRPKQFSDEELLQTAKEIFIKEGPAASIKSIAQALGVSQAAIFKRYPTKRDLLLSIMQEVHKTTWIQKLAKGPDSRPFAEQLQEILIDIISFLNSNLPILNLIKFSGISSKEIFDLFPEPPPVLAIKELSLWLERCKTKGLCTFENAQFAAIAIMGVVFVPCHLLGNLNISILQGNDSDLARQMSQLLNQGLIIRESK